MKPKLLAGLELGARQFTVAVGQPQERHQLLVQAVESIPAQGIQKGVISDPIECADAVARLIRQAEQTLSAKVTSVLTAFPSNHLRSYNANASIPVPDPGHGISMQDVEKAVSSCRTLSVDYDRQILHAFERGFAVDDQSGVKNPVGLSGKKLTSELHLVTVLNLSAQNLVRVLNRSGLEVEGFILPGLAAADAVLSPLDRDLGVILIRIGDFETQALLFADGIVRETFLFPWGTDDLIEGLARSLKLSKISVEQLLGQLRSLEVRPERASGKLQVKGGSLTRDFTQGEVLDLLGGRLKEFLTKIQKRLSASATYFDSTSGIVMVGGLSRLDGFLELAEGILNLPVRLGTIREIELHPGLALKTHHTTAVGLLRHGKQKRLTAARPWPLPPWLKGVDRLRHLVREYF